MSYEVIQTVGKYQYIYLASGFRNEKGQVRQKRRAIGKVDLKTGQKIYKPEYLEELQALGRHLEIQATENMFSIDDINKSSVRSYGLFKLYKSLSEKSGLIESLKQSLPNVWTEVFMLSCYMISTSDPLMYCSEWISGVESFQVGSMTSQRISELLISITDTQRNNFYRSWQSTFKEDEYLALDITSVSSYSELIDDVEWGYNRDKEALPQINLCMLMGENRRLPLFQTIYSGSLKDVRTLTNTIAHLEVIFGNKDVTIVMDKGFYSAKNINEMLRGSEKGAFNFLIAVPFTASFAKKQVESERKDIDTPENTIVVNGNSMRAVMKERAWDKNNKVYTHIYYNAKKAAEIREDLYATVALIRQKVAENPEKYLEDEECAKYLIIRKSDKHESGYTINIRNDVIEKNLQTAGWLVIISNSVIDSIKALSVYREKDVVEKGFMRLKNNIDLGRLRVHSNNGMQGKLFVGFIASVIMSGINEVMVEKGLYSKYTMKELFQVLSKQRVQEINDQRIIAPPTKEQRIIFEAFGIAQAE